ncbi:MAG: hypothetical protein K2J04_10350 [Lachnospiraceae bacterium]|nr:hypothetical protein [Lachnospiraceae bacterium]
MKNIKSICLALFLLLLLTGCGKKDEALEEYKTNMEAFFEHIVEFNDNMNAIDVSQGDYVSQMLGYLDALDAEVAWMAQLEVPDEFSAVESLADEASENMTQAVSFYHMAYENGEYDENVEVAAKEYYDRANLRIQYIITLLHGEALEGEGLTYTEEDGIFGSGYMNKDDEEDDTPLSSPDDEPVLDDFDTDDTVFYEE